MAINRKENKQETSGKPHMGRTKRVFFRIFQVRSWLDWDRVKLGFVFIIDKIKLYFVPNSTPSFKSQAKKGKVSKEEAFKASQKSFTDAMAKLNIADSDIKAREQSLLKYCRYMLVIAFLVFCYFIYHLIYGTLQGSLLTFAVFCIALAFSFRYHFWYFQMREKRLGCSISEWYRNGLLGSKK